MNYSVVWAIEAVSQHGSSTLWRPAGPDRRILPRPKRSLCPWADSTPVLGLKMPIRRGFGLCCPKCCPQRQNHGNLFLENAAKSLIIKWCCQTGLNCRPLHYQWSALPRSWEESWQRGRHSYGNEELSRNPYLALVSENTGILTVAPFFRQPPLTGPSTCAWHLSSSDSGRSQRAATPGG